MMIDATDATRAMAFSNILQSQHHHEALWLGRAFGKKPPRERQLIDSLYLRVI